MRVIAIIPARGGSKGVPGKNLALLGGRPLIARTVAAAHASGAVDAVFVSTDCSRIAAAAAAAGARVIERPAELSGDAASSESALLHALDALAAAGESAPDAVLFLQCTSPFTSAADLRGLHALFEREAADVALTVAPFHGFVWRPGTDGALNAVNHEAARRLRRQDRPAEVLETGAAYLLRAEGLRRHGHRFFGKVVGYPVDPRTALEIDDPVDLARARSLAPLIDAQDRAAQLPRPVAAVVFDFDGVLTDDRVWLDAEGTELVACSRSDGMGISRLRAAGITALVLSKERNPVVGARCRKLQIPCLQAIDDKRAALEAWLAERQLDPTQTVFLGNDVNDVEVMAWVGCGVAVADAHPTALAAARVVLARPGGAGAARELADLILDA